jgi:hypothetical protein
MIRPSPGGFPWAIFDLSCPSQDSNDVTFKEGETLDDIITRVLITVLKYEPKPNSSNRTLVTGAYARLRRLSFDSRVLMLTYRPVVLRLKLAHGIS